MKRDDFKGEEVNKENEVKKESKKIVIALAGILTAVLVAFIFFVMPNMNREKKIKQADALIAIEKYEEGISIYDNLLSKKYAANIMDKRNSAVELKESYENFERGLEAYEDDDINRAVKLLSKVSRDDEKRYKLAVEELNNIEETILVDIDQLVEDGNLDEANHLINNYLKADSKNVKMKNKKESINFKKSEAEKQAKIKEKDQEVAASTAQEKAKAEIVNTNKINEVKNTANSIIGTYRYIVSDKANLRDAPTLKSGIVTVLHRGTDVYIHDTQVESADRIWCNISTQQNGYTQYGWISYNTMNYKIQ